LILQVDEAKFVVVIHTNGLYFTFVIIFITFNMCAIFFQMFCLTSTVEWPDKEK
jgi:hypothetical protein